MRVIALPPAVITGLTVASDDGLPGRFFDETPQAGHSDSYLSLSMPPCNLQHGRLKCGGWLGGVFY
jgi:hypothetical protein